MDMWLALFRTVTEKYGYKALLLLVVIAVAIPVLIKETLFASRNNPSQEIRSEAEEKDPSPQPERKPSPNHLEPGPRENGIPAAPSNEQMIAVNRKLDSWDENVTITLESIELKPDDNRMRWNYSLLNRTGVEQSVWFRSSYVTDEQGNPLKFIAKSNQNKTSLALPNGVRTVAWIDFPAPEKTSTVLTIHFPRDSEFSNQRYMPATTSVRLQETSEPNPAPAAAPNNNVLLIGRKLDSWDDNVVITLESLELHPEENRMRCNYTLLNSSGKDQRVWFRSASAVDDAGNSLKMIEKSNQNRTDILLQKGVKSKAWIDFQAPASTARSVTINFPRDSPFSNQAYMPATTSIPLAKTLEDPPAAP